MTSVQLSNNIVLGGKEGKVNFQSPTPSENLHKVQPQFFNDTFAYFGEA